MYELHYITERGTHVSEVGEYERLAAKLPKLYRRRLEARLNARGDPHDVYGSVDRTPEGWTWHYWAGPRSNR